MPLATFLDSYPKTNVVIEGHTDSSGSAESNLKLSQKRAEAVAKILTDKYSIASNRVSAIGYGEERPLVTDDSPENQAKNRRVTAIVSTITETQAK